MLKQFFIIGSISYVLSKYVLPKLLGTAITAIIVFFFQSFVFLAYKLYVYPYMLSPLRHLPGPKSRSLLYGSGEEEVAKSGGIAQAAWARDIDQPEPEFLRWISWFGEEKLTPLSARACRLTFTNDALVMPEWFRTGAKTLLGDGLVLADGARHHAMRKCVAPCFTASQMRHLVPAFWEKCLELNWRLGETVKKSGQKEVELDIVGWVDRVTFDMIGSTSFGTEFESLRDPDVGFYPVYNRNYPTEGFTDPWDAFFNYVLPIFVSHRWLYMLPVKFYQDMLRDRQLIRDKCQSLINAELDRKDFEDKLGNHKSLLSVLVHGKQMSDEDTIENMMTFIAAGYGTNSAALTWALYNLATNPEVQDKLRAEIKATLKSSSTALTSVEMDSMPYLHQFLMESSRLFPSVPGTFRETARKTQIDSLTIPAGTSIIASMVAVNRSKSIWGEDADKLRPERWSEEERKKGVEHDGSFLTFLLGPKVCIGKEYSVRALKSVLISLVSEFEFSYRGPIEDPLDNLVSGITMRPKGGMKLVLKMAEKW